MHAILMRSTDRTNLYKESSRKVQLLQETSVVLPPSSNEGMHPQETPFEQPMQPVASMYDHVYPECQIVGPLKLVKNIEI